LGCDAGAGVCPNLIPEVVFGGDPGLGDFIFEPV